jgi:hypothetical protein
MSSEIVQGKWEGYFNYGKYYPPEYQAKTVAFTIELNVDVNGIIHGFCLDEIIKEMALQPATIEGSIENDTLKFFKYYPCYLALDENKRTIMDPDKPSTGIQYTGKLSRKLFPTTYTVKGRWEILGTLHDQNGDPHIYTVDGTWQMKKLKS